MAGVWSEERKLARWLDVELAALEAWAELGAVPADAVAEIREHAAPPTPERVAELERETQHDLAAFVDAVAEGVGPAGRWIHHGLTSSDIVDTGLSLQVRDAGELLLEGLDRALDAVIVQAERHKGDLCIGRTHGVHAEPMTFGLKMALWFAEIRARELVGEVDNVFHVANEYQSPRDRERSITIDLDYMAQANMSSGQGSWWGN